MYITAARHHSPENATPRSTPGTPGPLREIRLHVDDVRDHTLFPPLYYFQPSVLGSPAKRSSQDLGHYDSLTGYTSVSDDSARRTLATVAARFPPATLHPTGKVDASQVLDAGERKRRLNSRDTTLPSRPPARRPGHLSHKSASAIPTLSQINIGSAPYAPSPLGSPTTSTASARSSRRPSAASLRSVKSWLGRPATSSMATPQDSHFLQQPGNAADLLRQAMKHGSRYVRKCCTCVLCYFCTMSVAHLFSASNAPPQTLRHIVPPRSRHISELSHAVGVCPKRPAQRAPALICNTCQSETSRPRKYLGPTTAHQGCTCKSLASVQSAVLPRGSQGFLSSVRLHGRKAVEPVDLPPIPHTRLPLFAFSSM